MKLCYNFILPPLLAVSCLTSSSEEALEPQLTIADSIYTGGEILTMAGDVPEYAEAIAVADGRIIAVGNKDTVMKHRGADTERLDLGGKLLMPSFYDSHSHFHLTAIKLSTVNLDPPPVGTTHSIDDIVTALSEELAAAPRASGEWLYGFMALWLGV